MPVLNILIPVYNEKATLAEILRRVKASQTPGMQKQIIIVDDCSSDGTAEILRGLHDPDIQVIFHEKNRGKGAALRTALAQAKGDFALIQDADLEYDPADYPGLLTPLSDGRADVVYGSRFLGGPHRVLLFWHYFANRLLTLVSNVMFNVNITDMGTCYKAFSLKAVNFPFQSDGFGFEAEFTAKVSKRHMRIYEVPVSYSGRTYAEGKKITWTAALAYLGCLLKYRFVD